MAVQLVIMFYYSKVRTQSPSRLMYILNILTTGMSNIAYTSTTHDDVKNNILTTGISNITYTSITHDVKHNILTTGMSNIAYTSTTHKVVKITY